MDIRSLSRVAATRATRNFLICFWVTYSLYEGAFGWIFWANIYLSLEKFSYYRHEFFPEQSSQVSTHIIIHSFNCLLAILEQEVLGTVESSNYVFFVSFADSLSDAVQ